MSLSSNCSVCKLKITRNRVLHKDSKICVECISKINTGEYVINVDEDLQIDETSGSYYDSECDQTELDIGAENINRTENIDTEQEIDANRNFKDALLASLYAQVEFLKTKLEEKNVLIRMLIIKDCDSSIYIHTYIHAIAYT